MKIYDDDRKNGLTPFVLLDGQKGKKEYACQPKWKEPGGRWGEEPQDRIPQKTNACVLAIFLISNILQIF